MQTNFISKISVFDGLSGSKSGSQEISYEFLRKELPVRLANIMKEISLLPEKLLKMPSVILVTKWFDAFLQHSILVVQSLCYFAIRAQFTVDVILFLLVICRVG